MSFFGSLSHRRPVTFAYISLILVGAMWVVPFLIYYHAYPLTTFYQEWAAVVLGMAAMFLLVSGRYWQQAEIPRIVSLPIGLLLLLVLQYAMGKIPYLGQMLLYAEYLMWAALLVMLGARLREELSLPLVATALAVFLLLGAELNAAIGVLQHFHPHTMIDRLITAKVSSAVYGNIAQPNHFADYLVLGLASLGLLYGRGSLRGYQVALLSLPMLFVLPLSGSRSAWLYLPAMALLAFVWQQRDKTLRPLFNFSLMVLLGFGAMHAVVQLPWLSGAGGSMTTMQRLFGEEVGSGGIRLYLWHEAWLIFAKFPVLGTGFGQFSWQHFQLGPLLHEPQISGLYNNAHNLVMQLAAETGLAGVLVLFISLLAWLVQAVHSERSLYHWWGYTVLATLAIHSQLEYPLWYAYFIGIAALLLGVFDGGRYRVELHAVGRLSVLAILLLGLLSLQQLLAGYRNLESVLAQRPQSVSERAHAERMRGGLAALRGEALLQPYADLFLNAMGESAPLADRLAYNEKVLRFIPTGTVAYRQALLLAQAGDDAAAREMVECAIWAYPAEFAAGRQQLAAMAQNDSARFAALLEFAVRKYQEYQGAVHTK